MAAKAKKTTRIVIDDGSVRVPIENTMGEEIGVFTFRPTDIGIIERYRESLSKFDEITRPLEEADLGPDAEAPAGLTDAQAEALHEAERRLYELVDYIFAGNAAEAFFGKMHPFSPVNGSFYAELALQAAGEYIAEQFNTQTKAMDEKILKYTGEYEK